MFDHLFNVRPEMFHAGYFDPHGRTQPPNSWRVIGTTGTVNDIFHSLPVPGSLTEELIDLEPTDTMPLHVHTVVVQQGDTVDLVESFFDPQSAQKLASAIAAYAAADVTVSVKQTQIQT
jgi:hypothetical protein